MLIRADPCRSVPIRTNPYCDTQGTPAHRKRMISELIVSHILSDEVPIIERHIVDLNEQLKKKPLSELRELASKEMWVVGPCCGKGATYVPACSHTLT